MFCIFIGYSTVPHASNSLNSIDGEADSKKEAKRVACEKMIEMLNEKMGSTLQAAQAPPENGDSESDAETMDQPVVEGPLMKKQKLDDMEE